MLLKLFLIIIILILIFLRINSSFWNTQPVFHFYNILYWLYPPGIIDKDLPKKNKYINLFNIKTLSLNNSNTKEISNFIRTYYLRNKKINYLPKHKHIIEYLKFNNHSSYISVYRNSLDNKCIGVFSTRSINIILKEDKLEAYYADNLCIHPKYRKQGIAPQLIQTHYYNNRHYNKNIDVFLFKREGYITAIVPLINYYTYGFKLDKIYIKNNQSYYNNLTCIKINKNNLMLLKAFIKECTINYECIIIPNIENLSNLIKTNNLFIYGILKKNKLISCYIFKDSGILYNKQKSIECISTLFNNVYDHATFIDGFNISLSKCINNTKAKYLSVEDISNNDIIINYLYSKILNYYIKYPTSLFLYNYASFPCNNRLSLLLC
jgi:ribosomal protein S18 acetylase RimI-like enzyme